MSTVGDLFGRSGYGIGMPKGSPWSNEISLAVLHFHESGAMEELESEWINFGNCQSDSNSPTTLGLQHMLGICYTHNQDVFPCWYIHNIMGFSHGRERFDGIPGGGCSF